MYEAMLSFVLGEVIVALELEFEARGWHTDHLKVYPVSNTHLESLALLDASIV
jgi:hypothetical protein